MSNTKEATTKDTVRLTLEVSRDLDKRLKELATKLAGTKSDALRKAISLLEICAGARSRGLKLALVDKDQPVVTEIFGL